MNVYAVAYCSLFDNDLSIRFIEAENAVAAATKRLKAEGWQIGECSTIEEVAEEAFNSDALVWAEEIELELDENGTWRPKVSPPDSDDDAESENDNDS